MKMIASNILPLLLFLQTTFSKDLGAEVHQDGSTTSDGTLRSRDTAKHGGDPNKPECDFLYMTRETYLNSSAPIWLDREHRAWRHDPSWSTEDNFVQRLLDGYTNVKPDYALTCNVIQPCSVSHMPISHSLSLFLTANVLFQLIRSCSDMRTENGSQIGIYQRQFAYASLQSIENLNNWLNLIHEGLQDTQAFVTSQIPEMLKTFSYADEVRRYRKMKEAHDRMVYALITACIELPFSLLSTVSGFSKTAKAVASITGSRAGLNPKEISKEQIDQTKELISSFRNGATIVNTVGLSYAGMKGIKYSATTGIRYV
jgi:hypothetical protein